MLNFNISKLVYCLNVTPHLQSKSKKLGTSLLLGACTVQSPCPCEVLLKSAVWESFNNFQLCEGGGGGNGLSAQTSLLGVVGTSKAKQ